MEVFQSLIIVWYRTLEGVIPSIISTTIIPSKSRCAEERRVYSINARSSYITLSFLGFLVVLHEHLPVFWLVFFFLFKRKKDIYQCTFLYIMRGQRECFWINVLSILCCKVSAIYTRNKSLLRKMYEFSLFFYFLFFS